MRIGLGWFLMCLAAFPLGAAAYYSWAEQQPTRLCFIADQLPTVADGFVKIPIR